MGSINVSPLLEDFVVVTWIVKGVCCNELDDICFALL